MSRWFRHYAGMCADPKFGGVARRAKVGRDRVVFVFAFILESASERNSGGAYDWDADAIADLLNCETDEIARVHGELEASGIVEDRRIINWSKRQYESDKDPTAADRQRRFRERQALENQTKTVTVTPVTDSSRVTNAPHSTETDTERKKENSPKRVRTPYPDDFESLWNACAEWRGHSGKKEAADEWRKLSPEDRLAAMAGVSGYSASMRVPNAPTPLHVCRFLKYRRFEVYVGGVVSISGAPADRAAVLANVGKRWVEYDTPEWTRVADLWKAERGTYPPHPQGGWYFPESYFARAEAAA